MGRATSRLLLTHGTLAAAIAIVAACSRDPDPVQPRCALAPDGDTVRVTFGASITPHVSATCVGLSQQPAVRWTSSDPSVVAVDSLTGVVTGMRAGVATLHATVPGLSTATASLVAIVSCPPLALLPVVITPQAVVLTVNGSVTVRASAARPVGGPTCAVVVDTAVTFTSLDTTIAVVSTSGLVTGRRGGQTAVRASLVANPNLIASIPVTVLSTSPVARVDVDPASLDLPSWGTASIVARAVLDADPPVATSRAVTFATSDSCVVRVSPLGDVRAGASGFATVTVAAVANPNALARIPVQVGFTRSPPRPTFRSFMSGSPPVPVDLDAVRGRITVTLNVDRNMLTRAARVAYRTGCSRSRPPSPTGRRRRRSPTVRPGPRR